METRNLKMHQIFCAAAFVLAGSLATQAADLKVKFVYGGDAEKPGAIDVNKDVEFCGKHGLVNEKLLVNPKNKGIQNVILYIYTGRGGTDLDDLGDIKPAKKTHVLANDKCRFEPRVVITQAGDTLKITNPDDVGHNANLGFFNNVGQNFTIPAKQEKSVELPLSEPAPMPVECNIHPWMKAYVVVLEHPFAAVSDANGELTITGLPAGEDLVFRVNHEAGKIEDVTVDGKEESWSRSKFEIELEEGMNDLGTVVIPADSLSAN